MISNTRGQLTALLGLIFPLWAVANLRWRQGRARARQRLKRMRSDATSDATTWEPPSQRPEPREPGDIDSIFRRMNRPRQPWQAFADELKAEERGRMQAWRLDDWRDGLRTYRYTHTHTHTHTHTADNFSRSFLYDR
jgi:hypothetical protein